MLELIPTSKLPKDAHSCDHLRGQAKYFLRIQYLGKYYYFPMTKEMKKVFGISIRGGEAITEKSHLYIENLLRDLISAVYLQIQGTVAEDIHNALSTQIKDSFERMFEDGLFKTVTNKLNQKLLPGADHVD
jgi:hypothetical protein